MAVRERLDERRDSLTPAERRVATVVVDDPEAVAFGTVATLAAQAGAGAATVVRLAERLGYEGFGGLQAAVRDDLSGRLRVASERIRRPAAHDDLAARVLSVEVDNVVTTFEHIDRAALHHAVLLLARRRARVTVVPGGASIGVARQFSDELSLVRRDVTLVSGSPVALAARTADVGRDDVLVAIDLRRHDRSVLDTVDAAATAGASVIAVTDTILSPLAGLASAALIVAAEGAGPLDSHLGVLAVANALVAGVAGRLRGSATGRIDRIEHAWRATGALVES